MQLIGLLDSPYVRRVAVSLQCLGLPFSHRPISVFRGFDQFREINPVVKAPTLVCDDGTVLLDSSLILQYAEALPGAARSLWPTSGLPAALRTVGLALAACEKSVQIVYEHHLRPAEKLHAPWLDRVTGQLRAALDLIETELPRHPLPMGETTIDQAGITVAVVWHFIQQMTPEAAPADRYPALAALSAQAEALPAFRAAPHGEGTYAG